jgi:hypothetical protein
MIMQLLPSDFPDVCGKFYFLFYQCSYRFSVEFSLLGLAYGFFLSQSPGFLFGNHKHLTKVLDFRFVLEVFLKNPLAGLDSIRFLVYISIKTK